MIDLGADPNQCDPRFPVNGPLCEVQSCRQPEDVLLENCRILSEAGVSREGMESLIQELERIPHKPTSKILKYPLQEAGRKKTFANGSI
jgi:hypothetical protein